MKSYETRSCLTAGSSARRTRRVTHPTPRLFDDEEAEEAVRKKKKVGAKKEK
jgi:hypothetical protein